MKKLIQGEYNFNKDLSKGKSGEDFVINYMKKLGFVLEHTCNDSKYDFCMSYRNKKITYELKTDMYCKPGCDTGNIAIEIESRGKKSGINVTASDYFVTYFPHLGEIWNIKTEDLKKLIKYSNLPLKEGKGDPGSNTKFYLIKKELYKQYFKVHKI